MEIDIRRELFDQLGRIVEILDSSQSGLVDASLALLGRKILSQIQMVLEASEAAGHVEDALLFMPSFDAGFETLMNDYHISETNLILMRNAYSAMRTWAGAGPDPIFITSREFLKTS